MSRLSLSGCSSGTGRRGFSACLGDLSSIEKHTDETRSQDHSCPGNPILNIVCYIGVTLPPAVYCDRLSPLECSYVQDDSEASYMDRGYASFVF